jgi:hypothetical protein
VVRNIGQVRQEWAGLDQGQTAGVGRDDGSGRDRRAIATTVRERTDARVQGTLGDCCYHHLVWRQAFSPLRDGNDHVTGTSFITLRTALMISTRRVTQLTSVAKQEVNKKAREDRVAILYTEDQGVRPLHLAASDTESGLCVGH